MRARGVMIQNHITAASAATKLQNNMARTVVGKCPKYSPRLNSRKMASRMALPSKMPRTSLFR